MVKQHSYLVLLLTVVTLCGLAMAACSMRTTPLTTFHQKCGWKAEDLFQDAATVALCKALEVNDLQELDRLVTAGANVNKKGKGNITPLVWAFPDNALPRFTRMLEHGADPNVVFQEDFNTRGLMAPGSSVTHLACATKFPGYFEAVFANGGDPNLVNVKHTREG